MPDSAASVPVVVADVDTGIDDALALVYLSHLHAQGRIRLRVTTSAGNCGAAQAAANSVDVLKTCGLRVPEDVPVIAGAAAPEHVELTTTPETHGPTGLGYWSTETPAEDYEPNLTEALTSWEGAELVLVAGPASNIIHAEHGARVTMMCGAFDYPGNTTATAEWNAWVDPHALRGTVEADTAEAGTAAGERPTICPLNVTERVLLRPDRLERWASVLRRSGKDNLARLMEDALRFYFEFHESVGVGYCAQIHDLAAAMVMLDTVEHRTKPGRVTVDVEGERRGTTSVEWEDTERANADILVELAPEDVFREFERVVLGFA
ncbi:nucleoside hydrolase [Corynebacterium sp. zg254]|uniref:Nucleoside hydrolase n=1 Tax=Corynebacterium zhongnanshanii TaxID=2768834 RepID=A0ABQ6VEA7_9CORY|nr:MULTISPECIES: nucleoside hydrolase [Corynebacterium]KAB3519903.1 nucleoside hydrolase [Corynebacterium zhongnanshanii]MCR5914849.1 nucleoside hydrolase [Corynebacterium sp. zg254]